MSDFFRPVSCYFQYLAEKMFSIDQQGRILFFLNGPLSAPRIVPNTQKKTQMVNQLAWFYAVMLIGIVVLVNSVPVQGMLDIAVVAAVATIATLLALRVMFFFELRELKRLK